MADPKLSFKDVKAAFILVQKTRVNITKESAIIARIWYKSKAQHKNAEWFRAIDGVRKCLRRLLDTNACLDRKGADHQQDVQPKNRGKIKSGQAEGQKFCGALDRACSSLVQLWCSFWDEEVVKNVKSLPKFDAIPNELPNQKALSSAVHDIQELIAIMEELLNRTRIVANLLISHLRTPPAPTFAPITTACVAIMSALHSEADRLLHGPPLDPPSDNQHNSKGSVKSFYNILLSSYDDTTKDDLVKGSILNVEKEKINHHQKRKTLAQSSDLSMGKKQRSNETSQKSVSEQMISSIDETEEDLGEVL